MPKYMNRALCSEAIQRGVFFIKDASSKQDQDQCRLLPSGYSIGIHI